MKPLHLAVACLLPVSACAAQAPGDLFTFFGGVQPVHPGPFRACSAGYNFYAAIDHKGELHTWSGPPNPPTGQFLDVSIDRGLTGWAICLREDRTLAYWGFASSISQQLPSGEFTAIAAGTAVALALRPDGSLVQWGQAAGFPAPPAGPHVAIATAGDVLIAIRDDGELVAWGAQSTPAAMLQVPPGAFRAIAGGLGFAVGLRQDGTLAAWGTRTQGQLNPPAGVYTSISATFDGGLAVRPDGAAVFWPGSVPPAPGPFAMVAGGGTVAIAILGGCYANCDGSTTPPLLNVDDFVCFQQRFAAADPAANCDNSTVPPYLNVNDFVCFQQMFAAGCK